MWGSGLFKLDPSGACLWSKGAGPTASGHSLTVDNSGNVLVTGFYDSAMDYGGCPSSKVGGTGFFAAKLDPLGACLWSKGAGDAGNQYGWGVAVDNLGNVLVTGSFDDALNFGGGSNASAGATDFFLVKLDAAGRYLWSQHTGGPSDDSGNGVAVDSAGNVLVTGDFHGKADFGTGPLVSEGGADIFVAKYGP